MTTLPVSQRGRVVETRLGKVVTLGVLPAAWKPVRFYDVTGGMSRGLVKDDQMGVAQQNSRDPTQRRPGLPGGTGSRTVPLNLNEIGHWLSAGFVRATTGADTDFVHTFKSGSEPTDLLVLPNKWSASVWTWDQDVALGAIRIQAQKDDTTARAQLTLVGLSDAADDAAPSGTLASPYAADDFSNYLWQGLWNDVLIGDLTNIDLTVDLGVERIQGLSGDAYPTKHHFGETGISGSCRMYGQGEALQALADDPDTPGKFTLLAADPDNPSTRYFKIDLPVTQFEKPQRTVPGPGQMSAQFTFAASQDATHPAVTFSVGNGVASY